MEWGGNVDVRPPGTKSWIRLCRKLILKSQLISWRMQRLIEFEIKINWKIGRPTVIGLLYAWHLGNTDVVVCYTVNITFLSDESLHISWLWYTRDRSTVKNTHTLTTSLLELHEIHATHFLICPAKRRTLVIRPSAVCRSFIVASVWSFDHHSHFSIRHRQTCELWHWLALCSNKWRFFAAFLQWSQ